MINEWLSNFSFNEIERSFLKLPGASWSFLKLSKRDLINNFNNYENERLHKIQKLEKEWKEEEEKIQYLEKTQGNRYEKEIYGSIEMVIRKQKEEERKKERERIGAQIDKEREERKGREEKIKEEEKLGILKKDQQILKHNHQVYYETMDRLGKKENCDVKYARR